MDAHASQFKFYDDEEDLAALDDEDRAYVPIDLLHAHMDPFYNECRAYGRLIEKKINGKVAAQCYGYIAVPAARKSELAQRFDVDEAQWGQPDNAPLLRNKTPLRAIAKQLIREDKPLSEKLAAKMLRDLKRMRRAGVYPMDIRKRNYKGGLLLDMSIAMVKPHYVFDIRPEWHVERLQNADLKGFQRMVDKAGGKTWKRAVRNPEYCVKLRSSGIDPLVP